MSAKKKDVSNHQKVVVSVYLTDEESKLLDRYLMDLNYEAMKLPGFTRDMLWTRGGFLRHLLIREMTKKVEREHGDKDQR